MTIPVVRRALPVLLGALCLFASQAQALASTGRIALDPGDAGWEVCRIAAGDVSRAMGFPDHIMSAIAVTETGLRMKGRAEKSPWPWTVNVEGRGMRFATKTEAVTAVRRLLGQGIRSIDVGCMQVNLKYHPRAFTSLEEAFDPLANMTYAAQFLKRLHERHQDWPLAVRRYHSYSAFKANRYAEKFNTALAMEKRRAARLASQAKARRQLAGTPRPDVPEWLRDTGSATPVVMASLMPVAAVAPIPMPVLSYMTQNEGTAGNAYGVQPDRLTHLQTTLPSMLTMAPRTVLSTSPTGNGVLSWRRLMTPSRPQSR